MFRISVTEKSSFRADRTASWRVVLNGIHCDGSRMELTVTSGAATIALRTDNYYKIQFSALNFQPSADLKPCSDLENRPAKVEYVESANKSDSPHLIAIELHK